MIAGRNRALDGTVAVVAAAVAVCTFGTWALARHFRPVNAWQGSGVWAATVVLGLAGAFGWLASSRRSVRIAAACAAAAAAIWAFGEVVVQSDDVLYRWPGYVGVGLLVSLGVLTAGDMLRQHSTAAQVVIGLLTGELVVLAALPWWLGPFGRRGGFTLWEASTVWTVTVAVVLGAAVTVLVRDSRSTWLLVALPTAIAAVWAVAYTVPLPRFMVHDDAASTVAIAKFTSGPYLVDKPFDRDHLVASREWNIGTAEYAVVASGLMLALGLVLLVAAVDAVRTSSRTSSSPER